MIKTVEELKRQANKIKLTFYPVHNCSLCGYRCGYIINGDKVSYDSGCYCVKYMYIEERSWKDLAETYNINQPENNPDVSKEFLKRLNETWKFNLTI